MSTEQYNPDEHTNDEVNAHLATADDTERARVLQAEQDGQNRKGITEGPHTGQSEDEPQGDPEGLEATGNPMDLPTTNKGNVDAEVAHQDGAPEALAKLADEQAKAGYIGVGVPEKADYTQRNTTVMNGGA